MATIPNNEHVITLMIPNLATADTFLLPCPTTGSIVKIAARTSGTVATADEDITVAGSGGSLVHTVPVGTTAAQITSTAFIQPNTDAGVTEDGILTVINDGASTAGGETFVNIHIRT
jgi:hypothetical protein